MSRSWDAGPAARFLIVTLAAALGATGCSNVYEDMYVDDQALREPVQTAGSAKLRSMPGQPAARQRGNPPIVTSSAETLVCHGPLYFEDPFESKGSDDGRFAWTLEDYFALAYCDGRWLVNTMFLPASLIVHPIWSCASTDGAATGRSQAAPCCGGGCCAAMSAGEAAPQG